MSSKAKSESSKKRKTSSSSSKKSSKREENVPSRPPPPSHQMKARPRVTLDDFEITMLLGKGAYGEVYLARHKRRNRWMALKQMDKQKIESQDKEEHVKNEKRVLIKGQSPYLVRMHYSFKTQDCLFLAMEYCPGGDLRDFLNSIGQLEEEEAQLYFAEMIMAVHTLHSMGYIHRDLKPDNFLIDRHGHLKLADFGLSKGSVEAPHMLAKQPIGSNHSLLPEGPLTANKCLNQWKLERRPSKLNIPNSAGAQPMKLNAEAASNSMLLNKHKFKAYSVVGSPEYMSPEVTSGLSADGSAQGYSEEVDWWSLGCVFFEMLLGLPPFQGDTPQEIFDNIHNWRVIVPDLLGRNRLYLSEEAFTLLNSLLCAPSDRLGKDIEKLKGHAFFKGLDWEHLHRIMPPFAPQLPDFMTENV